jgi:sugar phosphate isomerase/epimerase
MRLGGPVLEEVGGPRAFVEYHQRHGFSAAYLPRIHDESALAETVQAVAEAGIVLAEFGAYGINVLDTDRAQRERSIQTICRALEYADGAGALCCVVHGGTVQAGGWGASNPENISRASFDGNVAAFQRILDEVKPARTKLVVEMTAWALPDGPDAYLDLLAAVDRAGFGVHLDPVNILASPRACYENASIIRDCFGKLGPEIVSCHAKDVLLKGVYLPIEITEAPSGKGMLDHEAYLSELSRLSHEPPLMIEHVERDDLPAAVDFILGTARRLGIRVRGADGR